ncbi:MAG TPA: class I SAM-dependent methyltransferase [Candidatus Thermoplasmatota archaeon]|nr:class I SAM-dependent methyltransferase [Candidatus Thermoplasmatota archaeon]
MADPIAEFKAKQREGWASFVPVEVMTTPPAARLVRFAGVKAGQRVLDVACGTGVVALTARRQGANVTGLDLTPELLSHAKENGAAVGFEDVAWREGDVEDLPYEDASFDVVLSQFGHMFAPRPDVATKQMLRVLKPGGTIAFSTWPPELAVGRIFATVGKHAPPPPADVSPPPQWGDVGLVRQRVGDAVRDLRFDRGVLRWPALSPAHYRAHLEAVSAPVKSLVRSLQGEPAKLRQLRAEIEAVAAEYFEPDENIIRMEYLMTRATKA